MEAPTPQATSDEHVQHDVLRDLAFLGQDLKAGLSLQAIFHAAAMQALRLLEADLCVIMLLADGVPGTLNVAAHASTPMFDFHPVAIDTATWELLREKSANGLREREGAATTLAILDELAQKRLNPVGNQSLHAGLVVPVATERPIGTIACYRHLRQWSVQELHELLLIADMLALASMSYTAPTERSTPENFVSTLLSGDEFAAQRQAAYLGIDLSRPRVVIRIELHLDPESEQLPTAYQQQAEHLRLFLQEQWPGTLVAIQENVLTCLVEEESSERLVAGLRSQVRQLERKNVLLWAGVSYPCRHIGAYPQGTRQADEALQIGWLRSKSAGEVTLYDEIGAYRYVNKLTQVEEVDAYQQAIQRIVWHDRHERTDLLKALRIYLACGGNALEAARRLGIHRNTMSKWLEQLQELCGEDIQLKSSANRVTLLLALMHYELISGSDVDA